MVLDSTKLHYPFLALNTDGFRLTPPIAANLSIANSSRLDTALAPSSRMLGCMCALLLAGAHTQLIDKEGRPTQQQGEAGPTDQAKGQPTTTEPSKQHAAPPQPQSAFAAPAPPDAGDPAMDSSVPLSWEIMQAAKDGKATQVVFEPRGLSLHGGSHEG